MIEHKQNKVLGDTRIFRANTEEVIIAWREFYNEELHNL
jgi:hypothetical protein